MSDYHAFTNRSGQLIVRKYQGEANRQQLMKAMKQEIGVFPAADIEQARKIARQLA